MENEEKLRPEIRSFHQEFVKVRNSYVGLKTYCEMQDAVLEVERVRMANVKESLEKLMKTCLLLERRNKSVIEEMQKEKADMRKAIADLTEQCDHLRVINNTDRNTDAEQVYKLEDEIEVLKAQLVLQEEKHQEEMASLKQQHSDELQKQKMLLRAAKQESVAKRNAKRPRAKTGIANKKNASCFRWPELDVEKINSTPIGEGESVTIENKGNKKRKLFYESDTPIDI